MSLLRWIYPPKCISCRTIFAPVHNAPRPWICDNCKPLFTPVPNPICHRCGHPKISENASCLSCQNRHFYFESHRAAFVYDGVVRDLIHNIKFRNERQIAEGLGHLFAEVIRDFGFNGDYIIPVPLYPAKKRVRGFNQASVLARPLSDVLEIPIVENMIKRVKKTAPQSGLSVPGREQNLSDAFKFNGKKYDITDKMILLVDDIFTSGATMNTCAKVFMDHNAARVICLSLSIAVRDLTHDSGEEFTKPPY